MSESRLCRNCYYPLPRHGKICSHCGQKYTDGRVGIGTLIRDFFTDVLNLDNKLWRTMRALFTPGKLTREYFYGRQVRYASPVRLFFILAVVQFFVIGYFSNAAMHDLLTQEANEQIHDQAYATFLEKMEQEADSLRLDAPQGADAQLLDSLYTRMHSSFSDSTNLGVDLGSGGTGENQRFKPIRVAKTDLDQLPLDTLLARYEVTDFWQTLHYRQYVRLTREGGNFASFVLEKMIWMILLMMPALAFILKLLFIRRKQYFVEHLIFSFHTHSFAFLIFTVMLLIGARDNVGTLSTIILTLCFLWVSIYPYLAMRRFYGQSRWKTFIKYCILSFFYVVLFNSFLVLTFVLTALTY